MATSSSPNHPATLLAHLKEGEDFRLVRELLAKSGEALGEAWWEPDPARVLQRIQAQAPDILLTDDRDGFKKAEAFVREARRKGAHLPLVVLTQFADAASSEGYLSAGADDILPRDRLGSFALGRVLRHALDHRRILLLAYESERRFKDLLGALEESVVIHRGNAILECNDAAARLFGTSPDELRKLDPLSLFAPEAREAAARRSDGPSTHTAESVCLRKDGRPFPVLVHCRPFRYRGADARLTTFTDRTLLKDRDKEIEYLLQRLRQDNERLVQSDRLKEEFIASISGDLRSPLTAIVGYLRLLRMEGLGALNEGQREAVASADENAKRLSELVADLLDLSRLDPGSTPLEMKELSVETLVEEAMEPYRRLAEQKGLRLLREVVPGRLVADPQKFSRVLVHLLGNSIKFTQAGGAVTVGAHPAHEGQQHGWLFFVRDSGVGIPEGELESVFDKFFRMELREGRAPIGAGIGLTVSRRIVEAHGGRIWAEGNPQGPGVVFQVFLPAAAGW